LVFQTGEKKVGITRSLKKMALTTPILILGLAAACGGGDGGSSNSGNLVPTRANVVGNVAIGDAVAALNLQPNDLLESLISGADDGDELDELFGIDQFRSGGLFGDVSRADIFAEATDGGDDLDYFGVLLNGSFDESSLIAALEYLSETDLEAVSYKGSNVYSPVGKEEDSFELSVLDDSTFAFGAGGAVNDVIDIRAGDTSPASGPLLDTLSDLDGGMFAVAVLAPENSGSGADLGSASPFGDLPISLDFIFALEIVGVRGELSGGSLDLKVTADFSDASAAESMEGFIGGIAALAGGFSSGAGAVGLLDSVEMDREDSLLIITVEIPLSDIPGLFGDLTSVASVETSTSGAGPAGKPEIRLLESALGVATPIELDRDHVAEGQRVEYVTIPPTSGKHWPQWADCGFYTQELPDERIVHNLEHGNIVVSYNFANPAQVTELRDALQDLDLFEDWGVARPYDKLEDGQIALTAWGRISPMKGVSSIEMEQFFEAFAGNLGPERIPC